MTKERERERDRDRDRDRDRVRERIIHDEDFGEENVEMVDSEWADFERFIRDFRERRHHVNGSMDNKHRPKKSRRIRTQAFYPCPPTSVSENERDDDSTSDEDDDTTGYINTLFSSSFIFQTDKKINEKKNLRLQIFYFISTSKKKN